MKRSILALIGSLVGSIYLIYQGYALWRTVSPRMLQLQVAGYEIRLAILLPAIALTGIAVLLNWIAFASIRRGAALAAAILFCASAPFTPQLYSIPLALALFALANFFLPRTQRRQADHANAADDPALDLLNETLPEMDDPDALMDADLPDDLDDGGDLPDEDDLEPEADDDLGLANDPALQDLKPEADLPRADGMSVFLGVFMGLVALSLVGIVIIGLIGVKLPFMP